MLYYTQRMFIANQYQKWQQENGILDEPMSVVSYLVGQELIDENKAKEFLDKHGYEHQAIYKYCENLVQKG